MVIFHSYVKLPEGRFQFAKFFGAGSTVWRCAVNLLLRMPENILSEMRYFWGVNPGKYLKIHLTITVMHIQVGKCLALKTGMTSTDWNDTHMLHGAGIFANINICLVVWNMNFIFPYIGNVIIPTDEVHHFSEG